MNDLSQCNNCSLVEFLSISRACPGSNMSVRCIGMVHPTKYKLCKKIVLRLIKICSPFRVIAPRTIIINRLRNRNANIVGHICAAITPSNVGIVANHSNSSYAADINIIVDLAVCMICEGMILCDHPRAKGQSGSTTGRHQN